MKSNRAVNTAVAAAVFCSSACLAEATQCQTILAPTYTPPSVASGWTAQLIASGLKKPRSIQFDTAGALLVADAGVGIRRITFTDNGGTCLAVNQNQLLVNQTTVSS